MTRAPQKQSPAKAARSRTRIATVKAPLPPIPDPPETEPLGVPGNFMDAVTVIPKTWASLYVVPGRFGSDNEETIRKALVPFAEVRLGGAPIRSPDDEATDQDDSPTIFSANLPLENLAYVLLDLTSDLRRMCDEIGQMANAALAVDPARMRNARYFVAHLERQARLCRTQLDKTYPPSPASPP